MRLFEVKDRELGVVLEGGQGLMPEQFLDVVYVRTGPDEFGRAASPEGVRTDLLVDPDALSGGVDRAEQYLITQPLASMQEERTLLRIGGQEWPHGHDVAFDITQSRFAYRYDTILLALTGNLGG